MKNRLSFYNNCPSKCEGLKLFYQKFCSSCIRKNTNKIDYHIFNLECYCGKMLNKYNRDKWHWSHDSCDQKYHKMDKGINI
jgi:hypothetical protein